MGGTLLKQDVIIENAEYCVKGEVDAWETCLWRLKVYGSITRKIDNKTIEFEYETLDREVYDSKHNAFNSIKSGILAIVGDLIIIKAIYSKYDENDPLSDRDLDLEFLFKNN